MIYYQKFELTHGKEKYLKNIDFKNLIHLE